MRSSLILGTKTECNNIQKFQEGDRVAYGKYIWRVTNVSFSDSSRHLYYAITRRCRAKNAVENKEISVVRGDKLSPTW